MTISPAAWEQARYNLVEDFIDLLLPSSYAFSIDKDYPKSANMQPLIEDRLSSLDLPERKLLRLEQLAEESNVEELSLTVADWATLFTYEVLEGFGHRGASNLHAATFEGLKELATTWGWYLAQGLQRVFNRYKFFTCFGDLVADLTISIFRQIPAKQLGEAIRQSITPAYIRAGEAVRYEFALLYDDQARLKESLAG